MLVEMLSLIDGRLAAGVTHGLGCDGGSLELRLPAGTADNLVKKNKDKRIILRHYCLWLLMQHLVLLLFRPHSRSRTSEGSAGLEL